MKRVASILLLAGIATCAAATKAFSDPGDWTVSPLRVEIGSASLRLGGDANGAVFTAQQPDFPNLDETGATGALRFFPTLERDYDSGLAIAFHASILAWRDRLAIDRYGGDVFEKAYFTVQT